VSFEFLHGSPTSSGATDLAGQSTDRSPSISPEPTSPDGCYTLDFWASGMFDLDHGAQPVMGDDVLHKVFPTLSSVPCVGGLSEFGFGCGDALLDDDVLC